MKLLNLLWGGALLLPAMASPHPVLAQCVVADVAIQAAIDGSEEPAEQTNDVEIESEGECVGNTSVNTSRQVHVGGTGDVRQTRQSRHRLQGDQTADSSGSTVVVPVEVQVDVYNPADRLR